MVEEKNRILGFADMDNAGYVNMLYVRWDNQNRGVATMLIKELERNAIKKGVCNFSTYASITAILFFEKMVIKYLKKILL
ncbi:MAG: GNAT family N-acetyltransferase [Lachnospirales bacterium]